MGYNLVINVVFWVYNPLTYLLLISCEILVGFTFVSNQIPNIYICQALWRSRCLFSGFRLEVARSAPRIGHGTKLPEHQTKQDSGRLNGGKVELIARWAQFHQLGAGLWKPPLIGTHLVDDYASTKRKMTFCFKKETSSFLPFGDFLGFGRGPPTFMTSNDLINLNKDFGFCGFWNVEIQCSFP